MCACLIYGTLILCTFTSIDLMPSACCIDDFLTEFISECSCNGTTKRALPSISELLISYPVLLVKLIAARISFCATLTSASCALYVLFIAHLISVRFS